ncbi:MAG: hypothetical protein WC091_18935 [Sulfuricellaceae bacterium]
MDSARRRLLQGLLFTGACAGGVSGLIREALAMGSLPIAPGIHSLRGSVKLNDKPAQPGAMVRRGDHVTTGADGQVVLVIERDAFMLRENTQVAFGGEAVKQALRLVTGKILAVFAQGEHRILIPNATIGLRGTGAYFEAVEAQRNYFCLCYGETLVETDSGQRAAYRTDHHESPHYLHRDGGIVPAPMLNHTDAELIMLENLVGRYPPFYGSASLY